MIWLVIFFGVLSLVLGALCFSKERQIQDLEDTIEDLENNSVKDVGVMLEMLKQNEGQMTIIERLKQDLKSAYTSIELLIKHEAKELEEMSNAMEMVLA